MNALHRVTVFLNKKASGSETQKDWKESLRTYLFRSQIDFVETTSLEELKREAELAISQKVDVIVSVGGDGSVNALIQHLAGTSVAVLIVPTGTANDLAREMNLVGNIKEAFNQIRRGNPKAIDLIKVNKRYMATNGGLGLSATVATQINSLRDSFPAFKKLMKITQHQIYSAFLTKDLIRGQYRNYDFEIQCDQFSGYVHTPLLMINNQTALGGKFKIAPETNNTDGTFNVSIFLHRDRLSFLKALYQIRFKGGPPKNDPNLLFFETDKLFIKSYEPALFYGDGEILDFSSDLDVSICPLALKIFENRCSDPREE